MFPEKQELKLKNRINKSTSSVYEYIADIVYNQNLDLSQETFDKILNDKVESLIDDLVQSTVDFAYFSQEKWKEVLGGAIPSPLNPNDTEKWLLQNLAYYKDTPRRAVEKLEDIRYNRIEKFRIELNKKFDTRFERGNLSDLDYIKEQLKNTNFDFKEWQGLRTDIKNLDKFSKEDIENLKKWFYRRNELWARNESGNLYAMQSEELAILTGIEKFIWVSEKDSRVRPTHKALDGRILEFNKAIFLPGQESLCRCHIIPIKNSKG